AHLRGKDDRGHFAVVIHRDRVRWAFDSLYPGSGTAMRGAGMRLPTMNGIYGLAACLVSALAWAQSASCDTCRAASAAQAPCDRSDKGFVCGLSNAEDLIRLPGTPWVLASELNMDALSGSPPTRYGPGPLMAVQIDTRQVHSVYPSADSSVDWDRKAY